MKISHKQASDRIKAAIEKSRLTTGFFQVKRNGVAMACLIGSISPRIHSIEECPANLMPQWMAQQTVVIFDNIIDHIGFARNYANSMLSWKKLSIEDWDQIKTKYLLEMISICHDLTDKLRVTHKRTYNKVLGKHVEEILANSKIQTTNAGYAYGGPVAKFNSAIEHATSGDVNTTLKSFREFVTFLVGKHSLIELVGPELLAIIDDHANTIPEKKK